MSNDKPWIPKSPLTLTSVKKILNHHLPQLTVNTITPLENGWHSLPFVINNEYLFLFYHRPFINNKLEPQLAILPEIAPLLTISIPLPFFSCTESPLYPYPFYAYHFIKGVTVPHAHLTPEQRNLAAPTLGVFLKILHGTSLEKAQAYKLEQDPIERMNLDRWLPELVDRCKKIKEQSLFEKHEQLLDTAHACAKKARTVNIKDQVVVHGDLYHSNIIFDENKKISGIIDWREIHLDHPAEDLSLLYTFLPISSHDAFFASYGKQPSIDVLSLACFHAINHQTIALLYGHESKNKVFFDETVFALNNTLECSKKLEF